MLIQSISHLVMVLFMHIWEHSSEFLLITTIIAGYIPARMIVKKNTLDAILGR